MSDKNQTHRSHKLSKMESKKAQRRREKAEAKAASNARFGLRPGQLNPAYAAPR